MEALYIDVCEERFPGAFSNLVAFPVIAPIESGRRRALTKQILNRSLFSLVPVNGRRGPGAIARSLALLAHAFCRGARLDR
jgi:hypothetical protein